MVNSSGRCLMRSWKCLSRSALTIVLLTSATASAQEMPADYTAVLSSLGKTGDFKDGVLKVNIPRNDLRVTISQRPAPTPFGFGGWVALTKGERDGRDDGRSRIDRGRGQSGDVCDPAERAGCHRAAQSLLLGAAADLLHARARDGERGRLGQARKAGDRPHRPSGEEGPERDLHITRPGSRPSTARRSRRSSGPQASRPALSTRSPSAGLTSTCASTERRSMRGWA